MENKFTKLSDLVGSEFTVEKVHRFRWKMWDREAGRMLASDTYQQGYRKIYGVETNKGTLDLSASQLGNLLEGVVDEGKADIIGRTFEVKSNGKTGIDIRYFLNPVRKAEPHYEQESLPEYEGGY